MELEAKSLLPLNFDHVSQEKLEKTCDGDLLPRSIDERCHLCIVFIK